MSPNTFITGIAELIEKETGIIYAQGNLHNLRTRLEELAKSAGTGTAEDVAAKILAGDLLLKSKLLDLATNNETLFFRDPAFFEALCRFVVEVILPTKPTELRIWSAASSTGQEALSVVMALDTLNLTHRLPPFSVTATDFSAKAIAKAKSGIYSDFEVMRGLSEAHKQKYFTKEVSGWQPRKEVSSKVQFGFNNLIRSTVRGPFHLVLCRNVLIYQRVEVKKLVVNSLFKELAPGGGIMLGVGETLLGVVDNVKTTLVGNVLIYNKTTGAKSAA